mmetsp:Transcript_28558/g.87405  ORF Transcript_28558/g.87405 Transcript_28558/m.87405 type:complete len:128 (-) Transcript_28558:2427-2810(-)
MRAKSLATGRNRGDDEESVANAGALRSLRVPTPIPHHAWKGHCRGGSVRVGLFHKTSLLRGPSLAFPPRLPSSLAGFLPFTFMPLHVTPGSSPLYKSIPSPGPSLPGPCFARQFRSLLTALLPPFLL